MDDRTTDLRTPVLIVGGGPVGLTLAIDLGRRGIECILIDKRPAPGFLPKMERCNARTMEHYRRLGIADRIRAAGLPSHLPLDVFIVTSLVDTPLVRHRYPSVDDAIAAARAANNGTHPLEPNQIISQYTLEPLLREVAEGLAGVTVLFGYELTSFEQTERGVRADVSTLEGQQIQIQAEYLAGCDGGGSAVRRSIGAELEGESDILTLHQALFRCEDLFERIPIGKGRHYHVADERSTFLIVQDDTKHFTLHAQVEEPGEMAEIFQRIAGMPIDFEQLYCGPWTMRLMLADRYQDGRVFIAGDAAHLVIPTGGLGMNTGAGDAIDLAWKIAGQLQGWAGPILLDTYETERRLVGARNVEASTQAARGRMRWRRETRPEVFDDTVEGERARRHLAEIADVEQRKSNDLLGIELGYRYLGSPLIFEESGDLPDPNSFTYVPTATPGARLPHIWLEDGSALHDHLGWGYSLLRCNGNRADASSLGRAFDKLGAPLEVVDVGAVAAVEVYECELLLIRPDLHVAWRGHDIPRNADHIARTVTGHVASSGP